MTKPSRTPRLRSLDQLNFHHLFYFHTVAQRGSIAQAAKELHLAMTTISAQIKQLERQLGGALFRRRGRNLQLTDLGHHVLGYAEGIFDLGGDLVASLADTNYQRPRRLVVGVAHALPKLIAYTLIKPSLDDGGCGEIEVLEDHPPRLLADLSIHAVDVVISDAPIPPHVEVRAFNHQLGDSPVAIYGSADLARKYRRRFPDSLDDAPFLMPSDDSSLRADMTRWFGECSIRPRIIGRFANSALLKVFAGSGYGCFAAPVSVERALRDQFGVRRIGLVEGVVERYVAISIERRLEHPGVRHLVTAAREALKQH